MRIEQIIVSENGTPILKPEDGFIVVGDIYVANVNSRGIPSGGLVGDNFDLGVKKTTPEDDHRVRRYMAFTKKELLDVLSYTDGDLHNILRERNNQIRRA